MLQLLGSCAQGIMLGAESRRGEEKGFGVSKSWEWIGVRKPSCPPGLALLNSELVGALGAIPLFPLPQQS